MVGDADFLKHKYFLCCKTFLWYQGQGNLSRSRTNIKVTIFRKPLTLAMTFEWLGIEGFFLSHVFLSCGKTFTLLLRSRSSAKVKFKYPISQKNGCCRGILVSQTVVSLISKQLNVRLDQIMLFVFEMIGTRVEKALKKLPA